MSNHSQQLFAQALHLPDNERADLAALLIDSLDPAVDVDAEQAWSAEILDRLKELHEGTIPSIPWSQARSMILDDNDVPQAS